MPQQSTPQVKQVTLLTKAQKRQLENAVAVRGSLQLMALTIGMRRQTISRIVEVGRGDSENVRKIFEYLANRKVAASLQTVAA